MHWQPEVRIPSLFRGYVLTLTVRVSCSYPVFACVVWREQDKEQLLHEQALSGVNAQDSKLSYPSVL